MHESPYGALNDRVRKRLRERKEELDYSEGDLAEFCGWTKSKVAHKLAARTDITLEELDRLCTALKLTVTEAVRDRGVEFVTEMTPSQLRRHETIENMPKNQQEALDVFLNIRTVDLEKRGATPKRSLYGKPRSKL